MGKISQVKDLTKKQLIQRISGSYKYSPKYTKKKLLGIYKNL